MPLESALNGDTQIIVRRRFSAPPALVFRAHVDPALIPLWMTAGDPAWSMPVCLSDPRPGGAMRFEWRKSDGTGFHQTGEYLEIDPDRRILHVERIFLPDPTPDNRVETLFAAEGDGTLMTLTMTLPDAATRQAILDTGMLDGMEQCYAVLDVMEPAR